MTTQQAPTVLNQHESRRKASLMDHYHAVRAQPASKPQLLLSPGPQPTLSLPGWPREARQTCLLRQMIHHLDCLTLHLSRGVVLPGDGREVLAAATAPAGFSTVSRAAASSLAQLANKTVLPDKHSGTGSQKSLSEELQKGRENWVLEDLGSTPSWYRRGNQSERMCVMHSWQSQRTLSTMSDLSL